MWWQTMSSHVLKNVKSQHLLSPFLQRSLYCSTSYQCLIFFSLSVSFILSVSLTVAAFVQTHLHNVREQLGSAHSAVGPHSSHPLYQQSAGDGRLQHHHHWLPWRTDLPLGHDTWAGGTDDSGGDINDLYVILLFPMPAPSVIILSTPVLLCSDLSQGHVVWSYSLHHLSV